MSGWRALNRLSRGISQFDTSDADAVIVSGPSGAEHVLELANLLADGARGDVQLARRGAETQVPAGGFEGLQGFQWGQTTHVRKTNPIKKTSRL